MTGIPSYLLDGTTPPIGYVVNPGNVPPVANPSRYVWTGAVTATSFATRVAAIEGDILLVSTIAGAVVAHTTVTGADITVSDDILGTARGSTTSVARATFSGLDPSTTYYLSVVPNGSTTSRVVAKLATFPEEGSPASFSFTVGSNARYQGDVGKTYNAMLAQDPLFFLQLGNLIYSDRTTDDRSLAGQQYVSVLSARAPLAFFANKPVIYVYGEHDYGPRNSNMTSLASSASQWAFSAYYPAYTLPTTNNVQLAYQAFTVGRVRFVLTDLFAQSTGLVSDPAARSLLGSAQKQMFLAELANFRQYQLIIWGSAKPWHRPKNNNSDGWSGYWVERQAIADAISQLGVNNLIIGTWRWSASFASSAHGRFLFGHYILLGPVFAGLVWVHSVSKLAIRHRDHHRYRRFDMCATGRHGSWLRAGSFGDRVPKCDPPIDYEAVAVAYRQYRDASRHGPMGPRLYIGHRVHGTHCSGVCDCQCRVPRDPAAPGVDWGCGATG
ncbi:PhoD-like phosphatase-domain-containing protein [Blastocladiella britannica]|nr:PhoD-like phosphatase-domain-containing protein [Blastocladiella britannica]